MGLENENQKWNAKNVSRSKSLSINLWQSKNTVFVPIRIYTDPLTKVLLIMQLASSPSSCLARPNLAWSRVTHTLRHASSEKCQAPYLTSHCISTSHLCRQAPCWLHNSTVPVQVSRRFRPNWHRKVNAHSRFLHSSPNHIQCKKTARAALRNSSLLASAREAGSSACPAAPEQHAVPTCSLSRGCVAMAVTVRRVASHTAH